MAQGVAWCARRAGVPCTVVVPDHAPQAKLAAIERLGGRVVKVPFERWWQVLVDHAYPGMEGLLIHPFADRARHRRQRHDRPRDPRGPSGRRRRPRALRRRRAVLRHRLGDPGPSSARRRSIACEVETAAPFAAARSPPDDPPSSSTPRASSTGSADGACSPRCGPSLRALLAGSLVVSLAEIAAAIRLLAARARVVAEGAAGASVAAAASPRAPEGRLVCVVSGGNIDAAVLASILSGGDSSDVPRSPRARTDGSSASWSPRPALEAGTTR